MHVEICVDYDGPSLSDTASLASRDEDSPEGSQLSFSPGELSGSSQDDDAVTVSSKDTRAQQGSRRGRVDSSLIKKIWNNTARTGSSSITPNKPTLKHSRSGLFNFGSRASNAEEGTAASSSRNNRTNERSLSSLIDTEKPYPDDPSAVFERLKLEEERSPDSSHDRSLLQTDIGKAWLKNQSSFQMGGVLRGAPSMSDDQFSLNTDTPFSDGMDILLQKDERGKDYYIYTGSGSSESAGDIDYYEVVNGTQPGKLRPVLGAVLSHFRPYSRRCVHSSRAPSARRGHRMFRMWVYPRPHQVHMHDMRRKDLYDTRCARRSPRCEKGQDSCLRLPIPLRIRLARINLPTPPASKPRCLIYPPGLGPHVFLELQALTCVTFVFAHTNDIWQKPRLPIDVGCFKLVGFFVPNNARWIRTLFFVLRKSRPRARITWRYGQPILPNNATTNSPRNGNSTSKRAKTERRIASRVSLPGMGLQWLAGRWYVSRPLLIIIRRTDTQKREQSLRKNRTIALAVNRYCQEICMDVAFATTTRFAERVTSTHLQFFGRMAF